MQEGSIVELAKEWPPLAHQYAAKYHFELPKKGVYYTVQNIVRADDTYCLELVEIPSPTINGVTLVWDVDYFVELLPPEKVEIEELMSETV